MTPLSAAPAKRPYATPTLVVHGTVQTLTQDKTGRNLEQDGGGSFTAPDGVDSASTGR